MAVNKKRSNIFFVKYMLLIVVFFVLSGSVFGAQREDYSPCAGKDVGTCMYNLPGSDNKLCFSCCYTLPEGERCWDFDCYKDKSWGYCHCTFVGCPSGQSCSEATGWQCRSSGGTGGGVCTSGQTETTREGCGNCGAKTRNCRSDGTWGDFGACEGQGETTGCGNCGAKTRNCRNDGTWGDFGSCTGEGPCAPTATQCSGGKYQTCSSNCQWENKGGTDSDSDGVDVQCEDKTCDIAKGICDTAISSCIAKISKEDNEALCSDNLDNNCDKLHDCQDPDCKGKSAKCCKAENKCWYSVDKACAENQKDDATSGPQDPTSANGADKTKRCIDGDWKDAIERLTPDGKLSGYCPRDDQCLVNPIGDFDDNDNPDGDPQCITDAQFVEDDYCENGEWSSRTKFVALQLIDIAKENDYIIFCDNAENSLNTLRYLIGDKLAENFVSEEIANNFCVLIYNNNVIIGTSLDSPIEEDNTFLKSISVGNCDDALIDDGQYHKCNIENAWYNNNTQSIIYSKQTVSIKPTNFLTIFTNFIKEPFARIINSIKGSVEEPVDESFVGGLKKFDKLYMGKQGNKAIRGAIESTELRNLVIEYQNFNTDICKYIDEYNEKNKDTSSGIVCSKKDNTYYVLAQGTESTKLDPEKIWNDLTSKLRVTFNHKVIVD